MRKNSKICWPPSFRKIAQKRHSAAASKPLFWALFGRGVWVLWRGVFSLISRGIFQTRPPTVFCSWLTIFRPYGNSNSKCELKSALYRGIKDPKTRLQKAVGVGTHKSLKTTQNSFKSVGFAEWEARMKARAKFEPSADWAINRTSRLHHTTAKIDSY